MKLVIFILLILLVFFSLLLYKTYKVGVKKTDYKLSTDNERIDAYAKTLSTMIQYETVSDSDNPQIEKFRGFHKVMEELFPNIFKTCEKIEIDGNLMMKWSGTDSSLQPIIFISHMDVVPAEGDWKYPPFSGTIAEGKIWGRGTADIKGGLFCFYQAVEEMIKDGYKPKCDVYLGSSCTEEIGGTGAPKMVNWFKEHNIELYMLCDEGGAIVQDPVSGIKGNFAAIGVFEKGYGDLKITAKGNGGHSSTPPKNTPIVRLAKFISEVEDHDPFKAQFSPAVTMMFKNLAPYCTSFPLKVVLSNIDIFKPILAKVMPAISSEAAAMLKTTIAFTMQKGSNGYNVIPAEAYVTANLRYIPHQKADESNEIVKNLAKKYDLETEVLVASNPSTPINLDGEQYHMICKAIEKALPNVGIMPYVVTGGTDSKFFDPVCKNCIRFSPINYGPEQMEGMHGINENVEAACLPLAVDFYKELVKMQETRK